MFTYAQFIGKYLITLFTWFPIKDKIPELEHIPYPKTCMLCFKALMVLW